MKSVFASRKFWFTLLTLLVIIISAFVPDFQLDVEHVASLVVIVVSYLLGVAADPGPGGWKGVINSRKFWGAAVGVLVTFLDAFHLVLPYGLSPELLISFAVTVGAFIGGVAIEGTRPKPLNTVELQGKVAAFDREAIIREFGE